MIVKSVYDISTGETTIEPLSPEEIQELQQQALIEAAEMVRLERNAKLASSDWTQVLDAPVDRSAWAAYRQALRDIPSQPSFPLDVVWPEHPN